jgi:hypothetical protein
MRIVMRSFIVFVSLILASPAMAGYDSAYTDFIPEKCKQIKPGAAEGEGEFSPTFECRGYAGLAVTFAEGDLR